MEEAAVAVVAAVVVAAAVAVHSRLLYRFSSDRLFFRAIRMLLPARSVFASGSKLIEEGTIN